MHSAKWDSSYELKGKTVAVIGGGSSAVQIIPSIQPIVNKLLPFLRSPVWITTGFGAKYAGPGGTNFDYPREQIAEFNADSEAYTRYARDVEGELNKRFTLMHLKAKDQKTSRDLVAGIMTERLGNDPTSDKEDDSTVCTRLSTHDARVRIFRIATRAKCRSHHLIGS